MIKIGEEFEAVDRLGLVSTWRLKAIDEDKKYYLEAIGETLRRCEADYDLLNKIKPETTSWEECCTIKVDEEWFRLRKITVIEENGI